MNVIIIMGLSKVTTHPITTYLVAGALIHIIFEYSGGNKWWCEKMYTTSNDKKQSEKKYRHSTSQ
jgi:hypothetical protein